jgi:hypothetical protein
VETERRANNGFSPIDFTDRDGCGLGMSVVRPITAYTAKGPKVCQRRVGALSRLQYFAQLRQDQDPLRGRLGSYS